jgi:hypothetical protein
MTGRRHALAQGPDRDDMDMDMRQPLGRLGATSEEKIQRTKVHVIVALVSRVPPLATPLFVITRALCVFSHHKALANT